MEPEKITPSDKNMSVIDAIHRRRAVRDYTNQKIDQTTIHTLLDAAVHAPTAMHEEPWSFVIVQDKKILDRLSKRIKELLAKETDIIHPLRGSHVPHSFTDPQFNAFYNAETLVVICGKSMGPFVQADCWLAAENLMLAACAKGLGTCVIGLAVPALNTPEWKKELGIPDEITAIAPIIVGVPATKTPAVPRKQPEILIWK